MPFSRLILYHFAAWHTILANSHPLDLLPFDYVFSDDLNADTSTSLGLSWPPPPSPPSLPSPPSPPSLSVASDMITSSDESLLANPLFAPTSEDDSGDYPDPVLVSSLPPCKSKRNFRGKNGYENDGLRARDDALLSQSCASEPSLPLELFSNPESYLRENILLNPSFSINREVPDEYFEPLLLPDGSENDAAKLSPADGDAGSPCAFPYIWHACCDFSFGCRPSIYFMAEMVVDCMSGCHLSALYYPISHTQSR